MTLKSWATPLTAGGFVISAVTGVVIFFHINVGLVRPAHEWLSWLMILGVVFHLVINWKGFKGYFKKGLALFIILLSLVLTAASFIPVNSPKGGKAALFQAAGLLTDTSLSNLAPVVGKPVDQLVSLLQQQGYQVYDNKMSLDDIAAQQSKRGVELLPIILAKPHKKGA
ncbi:DUF4405 domain-containing protein [Gallaecimonas mangrovi]|uniref:DUF4405 domain-containing protein n=1 Tax=Gallaecimonas mangrovi TaxID=2291597 RepID=UPI000E20881F|nr:DUF4405 domain-containing protein [Gallaecimonas mangrovi]